MTTQTAVPQALKKWFVFHFAVDILFAIPLLVFPERLLRLFGWGVVDPVTARLVAAALFGIGVASLLSHRSALDVYRAMLNLKIIWSAAAITGVTISLIQGDQDRPLTLWLVLFVFVAFNGLWVYWKRRLSRSQSL